MSDRFLIRQTANAALALNAIRPVPGGPASVPAFFAGWLAGELAPQALALTATDTAIHLARHGLRTRRDRVGLATAAASAAMYASLAITGQRARGEIEAALSEALGVDYAEHLGRPSDPSDLATPWRQVAAPWRMRNVDVRARRRLPYAPGGRRFELDIYHHRDRPSDCPVLLQIHGGGWVIGTKEQQGIPLMMQMASHGWVSVAVNYPLSPRVRWPEHLIAVKRAIAWIRENIGEYGGDPRFIAVTGGSAGAHLAAMAALTPADRSLQPGFEDSDTSVQACVPLYGVYDFTDESGAKFTRQRLDSLVRPYVMARDARYPQDYRAASPLSRLDGDIPPVFVIHGTNDTLVPVAEARAFVRRLREVSPHPVAYAELRGAQHAFDIFPSIRSAHVIRGVHRFLDWVHAAEAAGTSAQHEAAAR